LSSAVALAAQDRFERMGINGSSMTDVVVRTAAKLAGWYFHTGAGMLGAGFLGTIAKKSAPGTRW